MAPSTRTSTTAGETADAASGAVAEGTPNENKSSTTGEAPTGSVLIKFTGSELVVRRVTAKDFKSAGIEDMKDQEWSKSNDHTVDASDWPDEAVALMEKQQNFKVSRKG